MTITTFPTSGGPAVIYHDILGVRESIVDGLVVLEGRGGLREYINPADVKTWEVTFGAAPLSNGGYLTLLARQAALKALEGRR